MIRPIIHSQGPLPSEKRPVTGPGVTEVKVKVGTVGEGLGDIFGVGEAALGEGDGETVAFAFPATDVGTTDGKGDGEGLQGPSMQGLETMPEGGLVGDGIGPTGKMLAVGEGEGVGKSDWLHFRSGPSRMR